MKKWVGNKNSTMNDFCLICNGEKYYCSKDLILQHSETIYNLNEKQTIQSFNLKCDEPVYFDEIAKLYSIGELDIVKTNYKFLQTVGEQLNDKLIIDGVNQFIKLSNEHKNVFRNSNDIKELKFIEDLVNNLTEQDIETTRKKYLGSLLYLTKSHIYIFLHSIFSACISNPSKIPTYIDFISSLVEYKEETNKIGDLIGYFLHIICKFYNKKNHLDEINYILFNLNNKNMIDKKDINNHDVEKMMTDFYNSFNINSKFMEFDFISSILKDDDVEKLKYNLNNENIFINSTIENSFLFPSSIINNDTKIIQLCAFFGSLKCFELLYQMNTEIDESIITYAIFGGNIKIIKILKVKFDLKPYLEIAAIYHRNEIFFEIYYPDQECFKQFYSIASKCIRYANYSLFEFVVKEGLNINGFENSGLILYNAIKCNNLLITRILLSFSYINVNILVKNNSYLYYAISNENVEIVKALLSRNEININLKNNKGVYLFLLKLLYIWYVKKEMLKYLNCL